jgi:hypothetical protein
VVSDDEVAKAYAQLQKMADTLRANTPGISTARAFSKVFFDPANAELASRAHRRPRATALAMPT